LTHRNQAETNGAHKDRSIRNEFTNSRQNVKLQKKLKKTWFLRQSSETGVGLEEKADTLVPSERYALKHTKEANAPIAAKIRSL